MFSQELQVASSSAEMTTGADCVIPDAAGRSPLALLQTVFGHKSFKPGQQEAIESMLSGQDTIVLIPTGGGKTVIYTLSCLMTSGLAIVVSPLIMLMDDQVTRLRKYGINTCFYNTTLSETERKNIVHNLMQPLCQYEFLFVSPEAIVTEQFQTCLHQLRKEKRLSFFAIDEAHCIDTWGRDFRPSYQQLGVLKCFDVPIIALTGTATTGTIDAINKTLKMTNPKIIRMPCRRENLIFSVVMKKDNKAKKQVASIIETDHVDTCGIVYCATQADAVEMAFVLKEQGIPSTFYHAGLDSGERARNAAIWLNGTVNVICCTNAFGMGIDKQNVRFVIHLTLPSSLEDYIQESERGGRDGDKCSCILLFRFGDRAFHLRNMARMQNEQAQDVKLALLNAITRYCMEHSICRQQIIAKYFDDGSMSELCNTCDVCQKEEVPEQVRDCTQEASEVLECLTSMMVSQSRVKAGDLVMTYMGSKAKDVLSKSFHMVPQYGKGKSSFKNISVATQFIHFMIFEGFLKENLPNVEARGSLTFVTHGNIVSLLNSASKVFFSTNLK